MQKLSCDNGNLNVTAGPVTILDEEVSRQNNGNLSQVNESTSQPPLQSMISPQHHHSTITGCSPYTRQKLRQMILAKQNNTDQDALSKDSTEIKVLTTNRTKTSVSGSSAGEEDGTFTPNEDVTKTASELDENNNSPEDITRPVDLNSSVGRKYSLDNN